MTEDELVGRYPVGARVIATAEYRELFPLGETVGMVVGYGHDPDQIRVRRDGHIMAETYHAKFWGTKDSVALLRLRVADLEAKIARLHTEEKS